MCTLLSQHATRWIHKNDFRMSAKQDALYATRAATEEGIVPGGGVALQRARRVPARFSFVYHRGAAGWRIVDHHSSAMPDPQAVLAAATR